MNSDGTPDFPAVLHDNLTYAFISQLYELARKLKEKMFLQPFRPGEFKARVTAVSQFLQYLFFLDQRNQVKLRTLERTII